MKQRIKHYAEIRSDKAIAADPTHPFAVSRYRLDEDPEYELPTRFTRIAMLGIYSDCEEAEAAAAALNARPSGKEN